MWRLLFLAALAFDIALLYTLSSQWSAPSCQATVPAARDDEAAAMPYKYKNTALLPPLYDSLGPHPSHVLSSELVNRRDCSAEVRGSLAEYLCRVEHSVSFYSPSHPPVVIAKDISITRYFARRDLLGWTLAFKNISFDMVEVAHRVVSNAEFSVFMCLGIAKQDKYCMRPSSYHLLHQGQKVNQIHGIRDTLWRKDGMCLTLREALADFNGPHNFTFPCWVLPSDREDLIVCTSYPPPSLTFSHPYSLPPTLHPFLTPSLSLSLLSLSHMHTPIKSKWDTARARGCVMCTWRHTSVLIIIHGQSYPWVRCFHGQL